MRLYYLMILPVFSTLVFVSGCCQKDAPELAASDYGKVISTLPELPNKAEGFLLPETVESGFCEFAEQVRKERTKAKESDGNP